MRYYLALLITCTVALLPFPTPRSFIAAPAPLTPAQRASVVGYEREAFGPGWAPAPGGCTTRTALMTRAYHAPSCATPYRQWGEVAIPDPYTGADLEPGDVEIDHIYPLAAAWDMGAHEWTDAERVAFANDPRNLVVVSAKANRAKSDKLPSEWLPPDRRARCAYSLRLVDVARDYRLPLPRPDLRAVRRACSGLSGVVGRADL